MRAYAALLRGINVSGHNIIKMADLRQTLSVLDFKNLSTYLQSGNLIFESAESNGSVLEKLISGAIAKDFELDVKVKVIDKKTFSRIYLGNPFMKLPEVDIRKLYYINLMDEANTTKFELIQNDEGIDELMRLGEEVIYVNYVNGYGRSKIHNNFFEKKLMLAATARNHNTMKNLFERLQLLDV